ncbi:histidine kinase, partial [Streptomyces sp. NPDC052196]
QRLHPVIDTVLATALREGVTNILRHSKAEVCTIKAAHGPETILLTLVNDGVVIRDQSLDARSGGGSGLGNLRARLTEIGGELTAGVQADGLFQVQARAPLRPHNGEARVATTTAAGGSDRAAA